MFIDQTINASIIGFVIYRKNINGNYDSLGYINIGQNSFIDTTYNKLYAQWYVSRKIDSCNQLSDFSIAHKTINLKGYKTASNQNTLVWNKYQGAPLFIYSIYRGLDSNMLSFYVSTTDTMFVDNNTTTTYYYQVHALLSNGYPSPNNSDRSNITNELIIGLEASTSVKIFKLFPNPANDYFKIKYSSDLESLHDINVIISDIQGKIIRNFKIEKDFDQMIDIHYLQSGIYYVSLHSGEVLLEYQKLIIIK